MALLKAAAAQALVPVRPVAVADAVPVEAPAALPKPGVAALAEVVGTRPPAACLAVEGFRGRSGLVQSLRVGLGVQTNRFLASGRMIPA